MSGRAKTNTTTVRESATVFLSRHLVFFMGFRHHKYLRIYKTRNDNSVVNVPGSEREVECEGKMIAAVSGVGKSRGDPGDRGGVS